MRMGRGKAEGEVWLVLRENIFFPLFHINPARINHWHCFFSREFCCLSIQGKGCVLWIVCGALRSSGS